MDPNTNKLLYILLGSAIFVLCLNINSKATRMDEKVGLMMLRYDSILERIKMDSERCERGHYMEMEGNVYRH